MAYAYSVMAYRVYVNLVGIPFERDDEKRGSQSYGPCQAGNGGLVDGRQILSLT
jgi:hypothetical protein